MQAEQPDPAAVEAVVRAVLQRLKAPSSTGAGAAVPDGPGIFPDLDSAVRAACTAQRELLALPLERRKALLDSMRTTVEDSAADLARMAVEETGLGRAGDKIRKIVLTAVRTPGVEDLRPLAVSGDCGLTLEELAPWGVIGSITPSTNPVETIVCNGIGMIAGGNAAVFCPHPAARLVSGRTILLLNRAVVEAGGPESLLCCLSEPSVEQAQALMRRPEIRLLVVTGGPGVVNEAMRSGKRVIAAGPGNPPAVVDETADVRQAARDVVAGASLDNNIVCVDEKTGIVVSKVADALKGEMVEAGAQEIHGRQIDALTRLVLEGEGSGIHPRKEWVGKDAVLILEAIGARPVRDVRLILAEVEADHPLVWCEQLLPAFPLVRVRTAEEAMDLAIRVEGGRRHTATMHSRDVTRLSDMARRIGTSIFVKNGPAYAGLGLGGEGYTSFTIAGATGEGLTTARHFCRTRRCSLIGSFRIV